MGYDLHITRAEWHNQNDGHWITAREWLDYVKGDPELRLAGFNGKHFTLWSGTCEYPDPWFDWRRGNIYSKNPDAPIVEKMVAIATALGAKVQGDDGEVYTGGGLSEYVPAPPS